MKKQIHLNESELNRLVKESVRRVLREAQKYDEPVNRFATNSDNRNYIWNDYDAAEQEIGDKEYGEFLNTPNASRNFDKFPPISAKRGHNYDSLRNGTERIQRKKAELAAKKKEQEHDDAENIEKETLESLSDKFIKSYITDMFEDVYEKTAHVFDITILNKSVQKNNDYNNALFVDFKGRYKGDIEPYSARHQETYIEPLGNGTNMVKGCVEITYDEYKRFKGLGDAENSINWEFDDMVYGHDYENY